MKSATIHKRTSDTFTSVGIDWEKAYAIIDGGDTLNYSFDITPNEFLQFSEKDFQGSDTRALINSLSNAKRAIDAQADVVLNCLGIKADVLSKPRIQLLNDLGIVAPRIIKKIRDARNLLEHEYKAPTRIQVEDAIDVATLFIAACSQTLYIFPNVVKIFNEDVETDNLHLFKTYVDISAHWPDKGLEIRGFVNTQPIVAKSVIIRSIDDLYFPFVRLFVAVNADDKVNAENQVLEALEAIQRQIMPKK